MNKCLVDEPEHCLASARELLERIDKTITLLEGEGGGRLRDAPDMKCPICGKGYYQTLPPDNRVGLARYDQDNRPIGQLNVHVFVCTFCQHYELFAPG